MSQHLCPKCNKPIEISDKFCPNCGAPISEPEKTHKKESGNTFHTISSSGNYSGTMTKGKGSKSRKIIRNIIIAIVLIGIIALIIWIKTDPEATTKLGNILFGLVLMLVFAFFIYRRSKKGKFSKRNNLLDDDPNYDWDNNDDDIDYSDDDIDDDDD